MNKFYLTKFVNSARALIQKRTPEILTGVGIAGMVTTTILAVKATPKALAMIDEAKREQNAISCTEVDRLKPIEVIKTTWKCYIPAVITCSASIVCLVGASSVNIRRNAA